MKAARTTPTVRRRIAFLLAGNVALLILTSVILKDGASVLAVIKRCGSDSAPVILTGIGMTGLIFTGAIDLSVASIIATSATVFGILVMHGLSPLSCYAGCVVTAWLLGLLNAQLVLWLRIPAIIVTLGALPLYRGLALILGEVGVPHFSGNISVQSDAYHSPGTVYANALLLSVVVLALVWEAYAKTPRQWLALGNSEEACSLAGLRPRRILRNAFLVHGLFLGLAALLYTTRVQVIEPARMALGFELQVIGAVVLGGTNIFGGEGSFLGTILGALFLYLISQVLTYAGASPYWQDAIAGAIIVSVIGLDCALHRRQKLLEELV